MTPEDQLRNLGRKHRSDEASPRDVAAITRRGRQKIAVYLAAISALVLVAAATLVLTGISARSWPVVESSRATLYEAVGSSIPECSDESDNDGDGLTDLDDTDCESPEDTTEAPEPTECSDQSDNDGDGLTDLDDADCESPEDTTEAPEPTECSDQSDNDGDGLTDLDDTDCESPEDTTEA